MIEDKKVLAETPNDDENDDCVQFERSLNCFTGLTLLAATLGGLVFGLDIGTVSTTSMDYFRLEMNIPVLEPNVPDSEKTTAQISMFAVLFHVFSLLGAPWSGYLSDRFGRKPVILIASTLFLLGAVWQSLSGLVSQEHAWTNILLGRCLGGVGNGFILSIMPTYIAELSPSKFRGKVITLFQFAITIGILLMAIINNSIQHEEWGWRVAIAIQCIPCAVIILMTILILPESPKFLMKIKKEDEAKAALVLLANGSVNQDKVVEFELDEIREEVEEMEKIGEATLLEIFKGTNLMPLVCGVMISFSQQVTGVNWFMNYATTLFSSLGFNPYVFDIILKTLNCVATMASLFVIDRFGRLPLTQAGTVLTIVVFLLIALTIYGTGVNITSTDPQAASVQMFCVIMIFAFQIIFAITWGPIGWLLPAEVMPLRIRSKGMSLAVSANMFGNIVFGDYGYVNSAASIGLANTMIIVVVLNIVIVLSTVLYLQPETKGVTLEEMRFIFRYEKGGSDDHGTILEFFSRNFRQSLRVFACKTIDTKAEIAPFLHRAKQNQKV